MNQPNLRAAGAADPRSATTKIERTPPMSAPRAPVLGWASFSPHRGPVPAAIDQASVKAFTTSGRAALYQVLKQLGLPPGSVVLVPSYHCPTMVAPVLCAGLRPRFFAIDPDGLPLTSGIDTLADPQPRAMIAAHYFGLPQSMADLRAWCDLHKVTLIEDCAHSFFGQAGERPVGHWGDFATASVSKFFPVPEAGVIVAQQRQLRPLKLQRVSLRDQIKALVDVAELGALYRRLGFLNGALGLLFAWKNRGKPSPPPATDIHPSPDRAAMMLGCDMGRIERQPLWLALWIARRLPRSRIVAQRRVNFLQYLTFFADRPGARPLFECLPEQAAPYVFPLWVNDGDRIYRALRQAAAPVFRWDHVWPGVPALVGDQGPLWSRHVLQLLCHQDLGADDVAQVCRTIQELLPSR